MARGFRGSGRGGGRTGGRFGLRGAGGFDTARSERVLDKAQLQSLLLSLLSDEPKHGYEMIRAIKSLTDGCYAPSPGMIYPVLNGMADAGLATPRAEEGGRKSFSITDEGRARLSETDAEVTEIRQRLEALSVNQNTTRAPIVRALSNLDLVLANIPNELSDQQVDQIVTLIDGTARQIERIV